MKTGRLKKCNNCNEIYFEEDVSRINPRTIKETSCRKCGVNIYTKHAGRIVRPKEREIEILSTQKKYEKRRERAKKLQPIIIYCARCGDEMVQRTKREDGSLFYGCSSFETTGCRYTLTNEAAQKIRNNHIKKL